MANVYTLNVFYTHVNRYTCTDHGLKERKVHLLKYSPSKWYSKTHEDEIAPWDGFCCFLSYPDPICFDQNWAFPVVDVIKIFLKEI